MTDIVILDGYTTNPGDISWEPISVLGKLTVYDRTAQEEIVERAKNAEILIVNKVQISRSVMEQLPNLKCVCLLATGYNNIDIETAKEKEIIVCNAVGYGAPAVAQHVFALLLELCNHVGSHHLSVQNNGWANASDWCFWNHPMQELYGKTFGVYGLGKIGFQVATIALAFGMKVLAHRKSNRPASNPKIKMVDFETLLQESDVLSLHAPLTSENKEIINKESLSKMKKTAFLINTGRGGLLNEPDLKEALLTHTIAGAGLDVLTTEPPEVHHPLLGIQNCIITPHHAWAALESRERLVNIVAKNIKGYQEETPQNVVY